MRLHCPKCAGEISAENTNIHDRVAKCVQCDNVFTFERETLHFPADPLPRRPLLLKSETISCDLQNDTLYLSWQWRSEWALWAFVAGVAIIAMMVWLLTATSGDADFFELMVVFTLLSLPAALLLYWAVAQWINTTTVAVDRTLLSVNHGPLPWPDSTRAATTHLAQLYSGRQLDENWRETVLYGVYGITQRFEHIQLLGDLQTIEHAVYIEQQIEDYLGIADLPVRGEMG